MHEKPPNAETLTAFAEIEAGGGETCEHCGAEVKDPCTTDAEAALCELPSFCFPNGMPRVVISKGQSA